MGTRRPASAGETEHADAGFADAAGQVGSELNGHAADLEADAGAGAAGSSAGGLESLGVAADPASLAAEVAAAVPGVDGQGQLEAIANASWSQLTPPGVQVISAVVFPAWQITPAEQSEISPALAECLEQLFPGGINGKYACWLRLVLCCGAITVSRVQNGGRIPPLFITAEQHALRTAAAGRRADQAPAVAPASIDPAEQLTSLGVP